MSRSPQSENLGRTHDKVGILNPRQRATASLISGGVVLAVLWHVTVVLLVGVPLARYDLTVRAVAQLRPLSGLGAMYPPPATILVIAVWLGLCLLIMGGWVALKLWFTGRRKRRVLGMADRRHTRKSAGEVRARQRAAYTRKASVDAGLLDPDTAPLNEVGFLLGHIHDDGEPVVLTLEDQVAIFAATGGGKSLHLMIPVCIDAPGPLVATATSPEILDAIVEARSAVGHVWVFDPLDLARWPEPMIWPPVAGAEISEQATARGLAFAAGFSSDGGVDSSNPFFQHAAGIIIARLLHAAALDHRPMQDVIKWALDLERSTAARDILNSDPGAEIFWARTLETAVEGADETLSSVRMTLAQKIEPLLSRKVLRQMTAAPDVPVFDPDAFVTSRDTLILITDDQADTNVAPLSTMLLNEVISAAKRTASRFGRLDPPLRIVGDEIPNVAPLPKLPGMLSNSRGFGIQWWLAFQSVAQILARWGEADGRAMLANLNVSMILGGMQDQDALERFSALVGSVDVLDVSANLDSSHTVTGHGMATTERVTIRPEEIRLYPDGEALVIYRNAAAMHVDLIPWPARPDGPDIAAGIDRIRAIRMDSVR